ncbi:MAG: hypothetical protein Pg6A_20300 [Termitinemataceae bacterium]|nr:MAG: hypothetical protein Pg6A_20300 [Termitinemataceae bacterium]
MDALVKLIERLPTSFLMLVVIAVIGITAWILPRLRRDKNGKIYIYSRQYETAQNKSKEQFKQVQHVLDELAAAVKRNYENDIKTKSDIKEAVDETSAWAQRTILFSENFSLGERLAAGSRLEQLSDGWKKDDYCYNGEARAEFNRLLEAQKYINRNEYCRDMLRPIVKNYGGGKIERIIAHEIYDKRDS